MAPLGITASGSMYYELPTQNPDVYLANVDLRAGTIQTPPVPVDERWFGSKQGPDWSADGKSFAYVSADGGQPVIVVHSLECGDTRRVALPFIAADALRWSPDGRSFKVGTRDHANQIGSRLVDSVSGTATLIVAQDKTRTYSQQEWLPDGRSLVMVCRDVGGTGPPAVVVRELATGKERQIFAVQGQVGGLAVSPDGRMVAVAHNSIDVVPVSGGDARLVADKAGPMPGQGSIVWSPDSRYLVYARMIPGGRGKSSVWFVPAEGGEPKELGLEVFALSNLRIRPDGRQLAFRGGEYRSEPFRVMTTCAIM